jgi:GTPase Era involved in 16S rRNA processing
MHFGIALRILMALGISLGILLVLIALLFFTESAFNVWGQLQEAPSWFFYTYVSGFLGVGLGGAWLVWRLLRPRPKRRTTTADDSTKPRLPDQRQVEQRLELARDSGIDVAAAERELERLRERRQAGHIYISLFGEISAGKSSLVRALLPDAEGEVSVRGGTTRSIREYHWKSPAGDELVLLDMPGTNEAGGGLDAVARDEALRCHMVLYVCDGDLTRSQYQELRELLTLEKPCILALNKMDRYHPEERELVMDQIRQRLAAAGGGGVELVAIQAGGTQEVLRILPDGSEELVVRERKPQVEELRRVIQRQIDRNAAMLESLRDSSVFVLVSRRLEQAEAEQRRVQAEELVNKYSRRAVVGAMAAVTPGTDLLIQGYLGMSLIKELSKLYGVPVRKVDTDLLLELVQKHVGKSTTLVLAIAGNALKAFPGAGTLAGGMIHAVAYGMVFDTLGRAVAASLDSRGELHPVQTATVFKETLGEDIEASARRFVKFASLVQRQDQRTGTGS